MMASDSKTDWGNSGRVGHLLCAAREARNLSTQQVAGKLRLDVKHIEAMERDEFTNVVAPVFARGYLRSYARFLELSPDVIVKSYESKKGPMPKVLHGRSVVSDVAGSEGDRATSWVVYLIILASLILGIVWWQTQGTFRFEKDQAVENFEPDLAPPLLESQSAAVSVPGTSAYAAPPPSVRAALPPSVPPQPSNVVPVQTVGVSVPATVAPGGENLSSTPAARVVSPIATLPSEQASVIAAIPADAQAQSQTLTQTPEAISASATAPSVVIHLTAKSWVDITDSAGNQLVYKLLPAGTSKTLQNIKLPLKLVLGNPAGVTLEYNGQPFDHSPYSRNGVTRFELGLAQFSSVQ